MKSVVAVTCAPGNKWTIGLTRSTPDPCPGGQKMTATTIQILEISDTQASPVSVSEAAEIWAIAFTSVLFCYLSAKGIGVLLALIKNG